MICSTLLLQTRILWQWKLWFAPGLCVTYLRCSEVHCSSQASAKMPTPEQQRAGKCGLQRDLLVATSVASSETCLLLAELDRGSGRNGSLCSKQR